MCVVAAVVSNCGTNVQKSSHLAEEAKPEEDRTPYFKRKKWWFGFSCTLMGSLLDFAALALASQSLVAALGGGSTLVCNVLVATLYNKETTYWTDIVGVVCIVAGAIMFAVFASPKEDYTNEQYKHRFFVKWFLIYISIQTTVIFLLLATISHSYFSKLRRDWYSSLLKPTQHKMTQLEKTVERLSADLEAMKKLERKRHPGALDALTNADNFERTETPDCVHDDYEYRHRDKYIYAMCGGAVGALSVLFGGIIGSMLFQNGASDTFSCWFFYFALGIMVVSLVAQTHLQNRALEIGDATAVFPVFEAFWISFGVVSGLIFYNNGESWGADFKQAAGIGPMLVGTIFLFLHKDSVREEVARLTGMDTFSAGDGTDLSESLILDRESNHSSPSKRAPSMRATLSCEIEQPYDAPGDDYALF